MSVIDLEMQVALSKLSRAADMVKPEDVARLAPLLEAVMDVVSAYRNGLSAAEIRDVRLHAGAPAMMSALLELRDMTDGEEDADERGQPNWAMRVATIAERALEAAGAK